jgi:polyisoprenyl-teichoic acid--peptidoglycan teichoic acid transferase
MTLARQSKTRLFILMVLLIMFACAGGIYLGSLRPFAPQARSIDGADISATPPAQGLMEPTVILEAQTASNDRSPTPLERVALLPQELQSATSVPHEAELTETAIPAEKTLGAIDERSRATWTPAAGPSPAPRAIDKTTNILLLGTDLRPNDPTWVPSTDVIMVVFIDTTNQRVAVLSLPRDLVVAIPRHGAFRINYVYQYGLRAQGPSEGADLLKQVLHDEFDIRIDHWALIDFSGLQKLITTVGGIDINVPCPLEDTIDNQHFVIPAGLVHMDYITAKRFVQSRYSTSDTSRNFRQQRVIWAIAKKAFELNALDRVPALWNQLHDSIQTDMTLFDMVSLIPAAYNLDLKDHPERIHGSVLDYPAVYPFVTDYGAWLYMPQYDQINQRVYHLFDSPEIAPTKADPQECIRGASSATDSAVVTPTPPP